MADGIFLVGVKFGKGLCVPLGNEEGVITEAASATFFIEDVPLTDPVEEPDGPVLDKSDDGTELSGTRGCSSKLMAEQGPVVGGRAARARIACRVDTGATIERVYL